MKIVRHSGLRSLVEELLLDDQSPAAISGRIKHHVHSLPRVSKNIIYKYLKSAYGRSIAYHRRHLKRKKHSQARRKSWDLGRVSIEKRPVSINLRRHVGHAEGDFVVSGKEGTGILFVIEDRRLRHCSLEQILQPSERAVLAAARRIKHRYPEWRSMTTDNDILFSHHQVLAAKLGIKIYFCHPYSSWEKGSVEKRNGVIRRYIEKGSDISSYSVYKIKKVERILNTRIMEVLNFRTPDELFLRYRKKRKQRR